LGKSDLFFQMLDKRVLPLGVGPVFIGGCNPEGFEFDDLVRVDRLTSHAVELHRRSE